MWVKALRILLHVIIWLLIYLLPYLVAYGEVSAPTLFKNPGDITHAISTGLLIAYSYANYSFLVPRLYLHRRYLLYALLIVASALIVIWVPNVFQPGKPNGISLGRHPDGPPKGVPPPSVFLGLSYNVVLFVISTFASISLRQNQQVAAIEKKRLNAELSLLKAQINPHFLFNTLNSIYALAIEKSDDAPKAIIQLSELMRYLLNSSNAEIVDLDKELNYINNYIALQKQRLGDTVRIHYSAPHVTANKKIAPLILMSFIENAFKHGVNPDRDSEIRITILIKDDILNLAVLNNKVTSANQDEGIGIGLTNTKSRLMHLYPEKHRLEIEDTEETFSVNLRLELA